MRRPGSGQGAVFLHSLNELRSIRQRSAVRRGDNAPLE